ncbi:MAG: hypothetical protein A4E65_02455 [Syntrophorhabdus sp. PtaU1.Bin153]|nr:MAG: hypothetical protein A4E65_02455 [Syntrophorhabdus sp. PtaU1.Bin153]
MAEQKLGCFCAVRSHAVTITWHRLFVPTEFEVEIIEEPADVFCAGKHLLPLGKGIKLRGAIQDNSRADAVISKAMYQCLPVGVVFPGEREYHVFDTPGLYSSEEGEEGAFLMLVAGGGEEHGNISIGFAFENKA